MKRGSGGVGAYVVFLNFDGEPLGILIRGIPGICSYLNGEVERVLLFFRTENVI